MAMDGMIVIGTKVDDEEFDSDLSEMERKIKNLESQKIELHTNEKELHKEIQSIVN